MLFWIAIILAPSLCVVAFAFGVAGLRARSLRLRREEAIFAYFAKAAGSQRVKLLELGVELEWVALIRMGHPGDKKLMLLEPAARSRVQDETEELIRVGHDLERRGLLRPFLTEFTIGGKKYKERPPATLVCLTRQGEALVNKMLTETVT